MIYAERTHGRMYYLFFAAVLSVWNRDLYWIRHWTTVPVEADVRQWRCERVWIRELKKKTWPMREWELPTAGVPRCSCAGPCTH